MDGLPESPVLRVSGMRCRIAKGAVVTTGSILAAGALVAVYFCTRTAGSPIEERLAVTLGRSLRDVEAIMGRVPDGRGVCGYPTHSLADVANVVTACRHNSLRALPFVSPNHDFLSIWGHGDRAICVRTGRWGEVTEISIEEVPELVQRESPWKVVLRRLHSLSDRADGEELLHRLRRILEALPLRLHRRVGPHRSPNRTARR